jgi:hypothetical protein
MPPPASDDAFAHALAPLLEVQQRGRIRPATPNDVLELLESNAGRYVLKGRRGYMAVGGNGWTSRQRKALVIPDRATAHEGRRMGIRDNGIVVKVVRLRRKGTCGIEGVRLRPGIKVKANDEFIGIDVSDAEAMAFLAALTGAKEGEAEQ